MNDEQKKELVSTDDLDGVELSDEALDQISGGFVYHDVGDPKAHRREAFYVLDNAGKVVLRFDDMAKAKHWADNLRTDQRVINADEFNKLRANHGL